MNNHDTLRTRAKALNLFGLLANWEDAAAAGWVRTLLDWEDQERARRSLERRLRAARIGRFNPLCDFDWSWPKNCDRAGIEALMALDFLKDATNIVLVGPNGIGKSTLAQNIAHQAVVNGHTVMFTSAGQMLGDLAHSTATRLCDGACATTRRRAWWSSTRSATSPIPTATPICSSSSSAAAMNKKAR